MSMFTDLVKQGKVMVSGIHMSVASKLNRVVGDIMGHGGKLPFTLRFVKKTDETAYLKVTLADGTEPKGAVVINDDGGDQIIGFYHPTFNGSDAWKMVNGLDGHTVKELVNDPAMEEARFVYKPNTSTAWGDVDASYYDVVYWAMGLYLHTETHG